MLTSRCPFDLRKSPIMTDKIVVFCTCASAEDAERIGRSLVESRLAACVSAAPGLRSFYRWQGKIEDAAEHLLIVKSTRALFPELQAAITRLHPFGVPEIIALPVVAGSEEYLAWIDAETRGAADSV
jgi:periplasmic divalent cation tolerance protein